MSRSFPTKHDLEKKERTKCTVSKIDSVFPRFIDVIPRVIVAMRMPSRPQSPQTPPSNTGGQYFDRRGEVNELKQALRSGIAERNAEKMRENIKKVIMYMTLGIDMSRLFSEMVMASQLGDTVQKKMVYLYLTTYAEENADLAILAVNTLQKDTRDVDPSVRGLALRSLCSLQLPNMVEYLEPAVQTGLSDPSGYVRKTAVLGVLKLSALLPNMDAFTERIQAMLLTDPDVSVVSNCISVLAEQNQLAPLIDQALVYGLLNRFPQFSEWGKCAVLESVVSLYFPSDEEEIFNLMNALDLFLKQSSAPVSFAIFKLFLVWTVERPDINDQVLMRIKDPLLTLLSAAAASPELQQTILGEIEKLLANSNFFRSLMSPHWKLFLLADVDTIASSRTKLTILGHLESSPELIAELSSYLGDKRVSKFAIKSLVHLVAAEDVSTVLDTLMGTATRDKKVLGDCLLGLRDMLRKFPENANQVTTNLIFFESALPKLISSADSEGLDAFLWLIAEYGSDLDDAPYQLEQILDAVWTGEYSEPKEDRFDNSVRIGLIAASVRVFLVRPLETRALLERVFSYGIEECSNPDVRDAALFWFRLLRTLGPDRVSTLVGPNDSLPAESSVDDSKDFSMFNKLIQT